jgi:hypothetical protein
MSIAGLFCVVVDVRLWAPSPRRCDERGDLLLLVEITHLLAPRVFVSFLPRAFMRPVVLVNDYWHWFALVGLNQRLHRVTAEWEKQSQQVHNKRAQLRRSRRAFPHA